MNVLQEKTHINNKGDEDPRFIPFSDMREIHTIKITNANMRCSVHDWNKKECFLWPK